MIRRPLWPVFLCSSAHSGTYKAPFPGILLYFSQCQAHRGAPLAGVLLRGSRRQALKGARWVGSYSVVQCLGCLMGQRLYCSAADAGVWAERLWCWLHPLCWTQWYRLASLAAGLSSTGISPRLLPHSPWTPLSTVNSSPHPGIAPQSRLQLPAAAPSRGPAFLSGVYVAAARTV